MMAEQLSAYELNNKLKTLFGDAKRDQWDNVLREIEGDLYLGMMMARFVFKTSGFVKLPTGKWSVCSWNQWSFLHIAAEKGNHEMVKLLIQHGANIAHKDAKNQTAADIATQNEHTELGTFIQKSIQDGLWSPTEKATMASSCLWSEAQECTATHDIPVGYGGATVSIPKESIYYADNCGRVLVGWHGSYNPPEDMSGYSMIPADVITSKPNAKSARK